MVADSQRPLEYITTEHRLRTLKHFGMPQRRNSPMLTMIERKMHSAVRKFNNSPEGRTYNLRSCLQFMLLGRLKDRGLLRPELEGALVRGEQLRHDLIVKAQQAAEVEAEVE